MIMPNSLVQAISGIFHRRERSEEFMELLSMKFMLNVHVSFTWTWLHPYELTFLHWEFFFKTMSLLYLFILYLIYCDLENRQYRPISCLVSSLFQCVVCMMIKRTTTKKIILTFRLIVEKLLEIQETFSLLWS